MNVTSQKIKSFFLLLFFLVLSITHAQRANPFSEEVNKISSKYAPIWDPSKETIVFTGSSSVRMWKDVNQRFPDKQIINSGFGGSQATDLEYFLNDLVLQYQPKKVFIYEGDNDIWAKKRPRQILATTGNIIGRIRANDPQTKIYLIAAKPSISRWRLKRKYKRLNRKFKRLAKDTDQLYYINVWSPMLNGRKLKKDIFIEDGLHMNPKGYDIWYTVMKEFVTN